MSLQPQQHDRSDGDHRQIVGLALLIPSRDPTPPLEPADRALHLVTLPVGSLVEAALAGLVGPGGDHRPDATPAQVAPQAGVAVALVTSQRVGPDPRPAGPGPLDRPTLHQPAQHQRLVALAGGGQDHHRLAPSLHPKVQLGGVAAAAAAQRLPIARLVRIGDSPPCPGPAGRRLPAAGARRPGPAGRPAPGPTHPGDATDKTGWPPSPRGHTRRAGPATAPRCGPATRSPPRSGGGPWAGGPSAGAGVAAVAPAWPTAHRSVLAWFVPWARTLPTCPINIANTP